MSNLPTLAPYVGDVREVVDAAKLMAQFGKGAGDEAAARANRSRDIGNHIHFCRWRQIERLIVVLSADRAIGTVH